MVIAKWLAWVLLDKLFYIWSLFCSWIVACFVDRYGNLPHWLRWYKTPDSNMFGEFGDYGFAERYKNRSVWWTAFCWQWRNPGQGFSTEVMGVVPTSIPERIAGDHSFGGNNAEQGYFLFVMRDESGRIKAFQFYISWHWSKTRCLRLCLGWKLWSWRDPAGGKCMIVCSLNPWKKYD